MDPLETLPSEEELQKEIKPESKYWKAIRKVLVMILALGLIALILSYFLPGDAMHIIQGRLGSYEVDKDYSINTPEGFTIIFSKDVYNKIVDTYLSNQETEVAFCLKGTLENNTYRLDEFYIPPTKDKEVFSVTSQICNSETLIAFHTHPYKHCIFSDVDIKYYQAFKQLNPQGMIGVMCEPNRFTFYRE